MRAVVLAAILEFCGAYFVGANVSETIQKGLIDTEMFITQPMVLILGMCAALLGTGIWLQVASYFGWPVSTTHAIVGAILGFGALIGGFEAIQWEETLSIAVSWVVSPALSGLISFLIFNILQRKILFAMNPTEATKKLIPLLIFIVFGTFTLSLIFNGLENLNFTISFPGALSIAILVGLFASLVSYFLVKRIPTPECCPLPLSHHLPQNVVSLDKAMKHLQRVRVSSYDETHEKVSEILKEVKKSFRETAP